MKTGWSLHPKWSSGVNTGASPPAFQLSRDMFNPEY